MEFLLVFIAYLLGSIPFGYLIVKFKEGQDVRSRGSGNIGATNVLRTAGRGSAVLTLLLDATKGYLAVWLAGWASHDAPQTVALAAIAAVLGHLFPVFLKFKGGKGVATVLGVFLYASPIPILIAAGSFAVYRRRVQVRLPGFPGRSRCVSCSLSPLDLPWELIVVAVLRRPGLPWPCHCEASRKHSAAVGRH